MRELAEAPDEPLIEGFGPNTGPHIGRLGRGEGSAVVDDTAWVARAHGRETTYQRDLTTPEEVADAMRALADQVDRRHLAAPRRHRVISRPTMPRVARKPACRLAEGRISGTDGQSQLGLRRSEVLHDLHGITVRVGDPGDQEPAQPLVRRFQR